MSICSGEDMVLLATVAERVESNNLMGLESMRGDSVKVNLEGFPVPPPPPTNHPPPNSIKFMNNEPTASYTHNVYGRLMYKDDMLYLTEQAVKIGRNSSSSTVHFPVGKNSFVSRKHLQVAFDRNTNNFHLTCLSKNGVFVNDIFQRKSSEPLRLPKTCTIRFPSTNIRILFESLVDHPLEMTNKTNKTVENSNVIYAPLKISIPEHDKRSPFPSPTGTISAANSCPTSPRHNYHGRGDIITFDRDEFYDHKHLLSTSTYNTYGHSKNGSANATLTGSNAAINEDYETDLFPPPASTSFNEFDKPPYSYAQLIVQSIAAAPDRQLTLSGIYSFISKNYPYYRKEVNKGWQNSIRHNLSLNRYFIKVARSQDEPGKGSFWRIDPTSESKLIDQSYKKRRQRGGQLRTPYGMPRSAPVSPSQFVDESAENSPLHDIVLQSAPGSPGAYPSTAHIDPAHDGTDHNYAAISNESYAHEPPQTYQNSNFNSIPKDNIMQHRVVSNSGFHNAPRSNQYRFTYTEAGTPNVIVSTVTDPTAYEDHQTSSTSPTKQFPAPQQQQQQQNLQKMFHHQNHQSIIHHQQIVMRLEEADAENNDDNYNHNTKRFRYDAEI